MNATDQLAYSLPEAAAVSGYSLDVIRRAIRAGDLRTVQPVVGGRQVARRRVLREDLLAWLKGDS